MLFGGVFVVVWLWVVVLVSSFVFVCVVCLFRCGFWVVSGYFFFFRAECCVVGGSSSLVLGDLCVVRGVW